MAEISLELISDIDMYMYQIIQSSHFTYFDANNLYGWAMSQPLPTGGIRWLTEQKIENVSFQNMMKIHKKDEY